MLVTLLVLLHLHAPTPKWDGRQYACPSGYTVYAEQSKAMHGKAY